MVTARGEDPVTITIVVPSYNQAHYLREALDSIVTQDPQPELIVMDGGSDDGSVDVIRQFESSITHWQSRPDGGQTSAIAEGFRRATGDVLGWLNSDDVLCPGALARVAAAFAADPDLQWLYGDGDLIDHESRHLISRPMVPIRRDDLFNLHVYLPQEATFFRREAYVAVGGVDTSLHYAMDYDLWLRLAARSSPTHLPEPLGRFRVVAGQKSSDVAGYVAEEEQVKARHESAFRVYGPQERIWRTIRFRAARIRRRVVRDGLRSVIAHAIRVSRGGQISPGTQPRTAQALIGAGLLTGAALAGWTYRSVRSVGSHGGRRR